MKHYIIDTNFVHLDYFLRGTNISILTQSAKNLGHTVYMPMVVFDELTKQYRDEVAEQRFLYSKFLKGQNRINETRITYPDIDFDSLIGEYEKILTKRCADLGIKLISYPKITHREVVKRELDKRKPFKDSTKGYRDALIWESLLDFSKGVSQDQPIVLLSQNSDDFAKGKNILHPDLVADCISLGMPNGRVSLITNFHELIQNDILPSSQKMEQQKQDLLNGSTVGNINVAELIDNIHTKDSIQGLLTHDIEDGVSYLAPTSYENVDIDYMYPYTLSIYDVRKISDKDVLISIQVEQLLDVSCFIYKGDLPLIDSDNMPYIFDYEWNDHYVAATDKVSISVQYDIMVDADFNKVNSYMQYITHIKYETGFEFDIKDR